ncbi:hepatic leukemia factor-like [Watersipora subatra]|uniref:hepatic leukemia factor-like n=1 Tax=Watersipora subatra TaxID=2589382 RepID=UPI00355B6908
MDDNENLGQSQQANEDLGQSQQANEDLGISQQLSRFNVSVVQPMNIYPQSAAPSDYYTTSQCNLVYKPNTSRSVIKPPDHFNFPPLHNGDAYAMPAEQMPASFISPQLCVSLGTFDTGEAHPVSAKECKLEITLQKKYKRKYTRRIANDAKDELYWARRDRNNLAAKRSRDAKRMKEIQIEIMARKLEVTNSNLKYEIKMLKREAKHLKDLYSQNPAIQRPTSSMQK